MREPASLLDFILGSVVLLKYFSWLEIHRWCETGRCRDPEGTTWGSGRDVELLAARLGPVHGAGFAVGLHRHRPRTQAEEGQQQPQDTFSPQIYDITEATPVFFYQNHSRHNNIKKDVLTLAGLR